MSIKGFKIKTFIIATALVFLSASVCSAFNGFESSTLPPVSKNGWGLKIVVLNVGQADAVLVITPNGEVTLIDSGKTSKNGHNIADFLSKKALNGVGSIKTIDLLYTTHYDWDHIGGLHSLTGKGIRIRKAFDQGISKRRNLKTPTGRTSAYSNYVKAVGDPNNNLKQDQNEPGFIRHRIHYGHVETMGVEDQVEIRCVAVRGDTKGNSHDHHDLDPSNKDINENPGSIALLIRLGKFEFYTAGDQTDNDWKPEEAVEESVLDSGAIVGGNDIAGKDNILVVNKAVHKSLKNYLEKVQPGNSDYLFASRKGNKAITIQAVNNMIKKWTRAINLAGNYGAHTLRKTWGYMQRTKYGVGFEIICKRFNHSSPAVTMRYLGIEDKEVHNTLMNEIG